MNCTRPNCPQKAFRRKLCPRHYEKAVRANMFKRQNPEKAQKHLAELRNNNWTNTQIAQETGLTSEAVRLIYHGRFKTLRQDTIAKILGVPITRKPPRTGIDNTGARRRIQGLMWMGWPTATIAEKTGYTYRSLATMITPGRAISAKAHHRIDQVFNEIHMKKGPSKAVAAKARSYGYAPPLAWDDIDNPNARPNTGPKTKRGEQNLVEDAEELIRMGIPRHEIAQRLGRQWKSIQRALHRAKETT